jgi:L,D-peptidoglycan transpeptidase YkuD (ErfK/YbiS/YcfS/YnhG family)
MATPSAQQILPLHHEASALIRYDHRKARPRRGQTPKRRPRLLLLAAISIPSLGLLIKSPLFDGPIPPASRLQYAKESINRAADAGAIAYASDEYNRAEALMQQGWMEMARQNGRISILRNYYRADSLLRSSIRLAEEGMRLSQDSLNNLDSRSRQECKALEGELKAWREALDGSLIMFNAERFWSDAELRLKQAKMLAQAKEYDSAHDMVIGGRKALARLGAVLAERAEDEAANMRIWRKWVENAIVGSRNNANYAIIIDKSAHKANLVKEGRIVHTYDCELGYNSARPKLFAGDGATPEGVYQICSVKRGNSKFYKALLLNYPNETDKRRFTENKRKGVISRNANIGKLIEIHGDGGNGRDWTDGCVALSNDDIDRLTYVVNVGTPVVIVRRYDGWK